jgi:TonB-linked SusC/RagA family outer membrane protein
MKKNKPFGELFYRSLKKTLKIMRISIFLLILGILQAHATDVYSQKTKFSLDFSNTELIKVLDKIEDESEYFFLYNEKLLDTQRKVSITEKDQLVGLILDDLFRGTDVKYTIVDRKIILAPSYLTEVSQPQQKQISGTITDKDGAPIVGANVVVTGTTQGTMTDINGKYSIEVPPGSKTLTFTFIGMEPQERNIGTLTQINIAMAESSVGLNEVVIVGYGTSKAKDLTSPIVVIKADEIINHPTSSPMSTLQGMVTGLQITNSGEPGASPNVRIRGIGSFTTGNPLYVVDGMFYDNIDFLSNNDIESISVMKDASSAAIYGVRAANGVILVTTKRGKINQKATVTYDGYMGIQPVTNMVKMANSTQYATIMKEIGNTTSVDASIAAWGGVNGVPATSTDWYKKLSRVGQVQNHNLDVSGGGENTAYLLGLNYFSQKGILDAPNGSGYQRFNFHISGDYKPFKWLKTGANIIISNSTKQIGNDDAWFKAFILPPIVPVYDENNDRSSPIKFADPTTANFINGYFSNPVAIATYTDNNSNLFRVLPSFYAEFGFSNQLKFRTSFSQDIAFNRGVNYTPAYVIGSSVVHDKTSLSKAYDFYSSYILDNVLTYTNNFGKNSLSVMLGQSIRNEDWRNLTGQAVGVPEGGDQYKYISLGDMASRIASDNGTTFRGASFFSRVGYDYDSKYLLTLTLRADGSSKYQEKWGYFPSVGLGWLLSQENFMKNQHIFDLLKLRASWGVLGNDKVPASAGFAGTTVATPGMGDVLVPGYTVQNSFSWLRWETVEETNSGVEMALLNKRLTTNLDYYSRTTHKAVVSTPMPITGELVDGNYGEIRNSGIELSLSWNDKIGEDFHYNISLNASTLKNKVISLKEGVPRLLVGTAEFRQIDVPGQPLNTFYGYKIVGIYQNAAEIAADPIAVKAGLQPGDVKFLNVDGNDVIDANDRVYLGSPFPNFYYGCSMGFQYKNVDFNLTFSGVSGNKILNQKAGSRAWVSDMNFTEEFYKNRWTGEGSTNKYPSSLGFVSSRVVGQLNDLYIADGSYLQIQNIQMGYTINKFFGTKVRLYFSMERPLTFFPYHGQGFTPEIADGIDTQTYPMYSTYSFGIKITY